MAKQMKNCAGKENFHRMNFLYQASRYAANISDNTDTKELRICADFISNYYSNLVINIAKKTVLRIEPGIKRNICKRCRTLLIPGKTVKVRVRRKPSHHVRWTCQKCDTYRTFNTKPNYKLWIERPEAIVESLEYNLE